MDGWDLFIKEDKEWKSHVTEQLKKICAAMDIDELELPSTLTRTRSTELQQRTALDGPLTLTGPFVTIKSPNGEVENVIMSTSCIQDIFSSTNKREVVRKSLLHIHNQDIAFLRKCTLTGRKAKHSRHDESSQGSDQASQSSEKQQLPLRTLLIINAVIMKMFGPSSSTNARTIKQEKAIQQLEKEARHHITTILNYFHGHFDEAGKKIPKSSAD